MYFSATHARLYLISFCVLFLPGALAASTVLFAHPSHAHAATPPIGMSGYSSTYGCLSTSFGGQTATPKVTVTPQQVNGTITIHVNDLIAFQFPFGQRWSGPTTSEGNLSLVPPAGYADTTAHACVWRFVAQSRGVSHLNFSAGPLCTPGQLCPYFIMFLLFTVNVV